MTTVMAYVPPHLDGDLDDWAGILGQHCTRMGYQLDSITRDPDEIQHALDRRQVDVIVVATREHAHPGWTPRVEIADEATPPPEGEERPHRLW